MASDCPKQEYTGNSPQGVSQQGYLQPGYPHPVYGQPGYSQPGYEQPGCPQPPQNYSEPSGRQPTDMEAGIETAFRFEEQSIRKGFIRKVYGILMVQLLITTAVIALFTFHPGTKAWAQSDFRILLLAMAILAVTAISMACCTTLRRESPMNFIFLFLFTAAESFLLGILASQLQAIEVMIAVGVTAAICLVLTLFAFQTKWDFSIMGGMLLCFLTELVIFSFIAIFLKQCRTLGLVYAIIGVLIFSFYLVYDTQRMIGGKHTYSISPEEYIFAALNLYLDIVKLFLYILLVMVGGCRYVRCGCF